MIKYVKKCNFNIEAVVGVLVRINIVLCTVCKLSCAHQTGTEICTVHWAATWLTLLPRQSGFIPRLRHLGL